MRPEERAPSVPRVRLVVLGSARVGKSALIVRYLTRRYIGEYHSNTDLLYRQTVTINSSPLELEVIDVSGATQDSFPTEQVQWADACLMVYAVTDRSSFAYAADALQTLRRAQPHAPVALLANKTDLDHLRQVPASEGRALAAQHNAAFSEASVADNTGELYRAVERLLGEWRAPAARARKFSVSKMLGTLMGAGGARPACARAPRRPLLAAAASL